MACVSEVVAGLVTSVACSMQRYIRAGLRADASDVSRRNRRFAACVALWPWGGMSCVMSATPSCGGCTFKRKLHGWSSFINKGFGSIA